MEELDDQRHCRQRTRLQSNTPIEFQSPAAHSVTAAVVEDPQGFENSPGTVSTNDTERSVQLAMGEIGSLSRDAMAEPRGRNQGSVQALAMGSMMKSALSLWGSNPFQSTVRSTHHEGLRDMAGYATRPSREFSAPYLDRFLDQVGTMFLHIDAVHMRNQFDNFLNTPGRTFPYSTKPYCAFNFYIAMAIGISVFPEPGIELLATAWHKSAIQCFGLVLKNAENLDVLNCIFLFIVFSMSNPFGGSTWHLLGIAMKKSVSLRLHREPEAHSDTSDMLDKRRRLFWSLYTLDRSVLLLTPLARRELTSESTIGYVMDRPFNIQDSDISVQVQFIPLYIFIGWPLFFNSV